MIQYKHYHDETSGYVDKLSKSGSSRDTDIFSTLCSFKRSKDTCFTYLPKDGKAYLLQVSEKTNEFYHGLSDTIESFDKTYVAEYINQLETEHRTDVGPDGYLPEGKLPRRSSEFGLGIARGLNPIFPEAIHTLLYTDKPLILVGKDTAALVRYVKVILALLPAQYSNHIGFSVCPDGLPSFFINPNNEIAPLIRIVATDKEISSNDSRVVINVTASPKLDGLGPYAMAVARMNDLLEKGAGDRLNSLVRSTCASFLPDGSVDREQLAIALTLYNFSMEKTVENAEMLIKAWQADKKETINTFSVIDAVLLLLNEKNLTEEQNALIGKARENAEINDKVAESCGRYAYSRFINGEALGKMQMDDVIAYLSSLPNEALTPDSPEMSEIFAKERKVSVLNVLAQAYSSTKKEGFLALITEYVQILDTFNYQITFDRDILDVASKYAECEQDILCAVMKSCYSPKVLSSEASLKKTQQRLKALSDYIEAKKLGAVKTVEYILGLKRSLSKSSGGMGFGLNGPDDYALLRKSDVEKFVGELSFSEKLHLAVSDSVDIGEYVDLKNALVAGLASYDSVKKHVSVGKNLAEYSTFMDHYDSDLRSYMYNEIKQYIGELSESIGMRKAISDYRCKFVLGSYSGVAATGRLKIAREAGATLKNDKTYVIANNNGAVRDDIREVLQRSTENESEKDFAEKQRIAEIISRTLRDSGSKNKSKKETRNLKYLLYAYMSGIIYVLLSAAIIFAVPIISALALNVDVLTRINEFFNLFHVLALTAVGVFNVVCYLVCWAMSNHDRVGCLKKASVRTFVCCVVPIILYALSYVITYSFL